MLDYCISEQAETILNHRYYLRNKEGKVIEDDIGLFKRVAHALAIVEQQYDTLSRDITQLEDCFFEMMYNLEFLPNSPTLMNAGTEDVIQVLRVHWKQQIKID